MSVEKFAKTNVAAVANEFIKLSEQETDSVPPLDRLKLQNLLFYAHAWHLANDRGLLFEDDIQAAPWGVIIHDVHEQTKNIKIEV